MSQEGVKGDLPGAAEPGIRKEAGCPGVVGLNWGFSNQAENRRSKHSSQEIIKTTGSEAPGRRKEIVKPRGENNRKNQETKVALQTAKAVRPS